MTRVVVSRPDFDLATKYGAYWFNYLDIEKLKALKIDYVDLYKENAIKEKFFEEVAKSNVVVGIGHGNKWIFSGQDREPLLTSNTRECAELMAGKWGSFLSCEFGNAADWFVQNGMRGFFGYRVIYYFAAAVFPNSYANHFFRGHLAFDCAWFEGKTSREAWNIMIEAYKEGIKNAPTMDIKRLLMWDLQGAYFAGDWESGPFVEQPPPSPPEKQYKPSETIIEFEVKTLGETAESEIIATTDKNVYKPSEMVTLIGRLQDKATKAGLANRIIKFAVVKAAKLRLGKNLLLESSVKTDNLGNFKTSFAAPGEEGKYDLRVWFEGD